MENKKFLKVTGKQVDTDGSIIAEATAVIPYKKGGAGKLPDVPPFNTNVWLTGDSGFNMMWVEFTENGKINYFYNHYYDIIDGKAHAECGIKGYNMIFDFELIDMKKNADYAIALHVRKVMPDEEVDEACSKFFGAPCLPESLKDKYPDDSVFFAQINCAELKDFDPDNRLPHEGYLYFFLDAEMYPSDDLYMLVDHSLEEPKYVIDDYNQESPISEGLNEAYIITFEKVDADYAGTKLLGIPSNNVDDNDLRPGLLLQYDPIEFDVPFLATCDGYAFVFFGETEEDKFNSADYVVWGS